MIDGRTETVTRGGALFVRLGTLMLAALLVVGCTTEKGEPPPEPNAGTDLPDRPREAMGEATSPDSPAPNSPAGQPEVTPPAADPPVYEAPEPYGDVADAGTSRVDPTRPEPAPEPMRPEPEPVRPDPQPTRPEPEPMRPEPEPTRPEPTRPEPARPEPEPMRPEPEPMRPEPEPARPEPEPARPEPEPARSEPEPEPAPEPQPTRPSAPPENVILDRNLDPGKYRFSLADAHVKAITPQGGNVVMSLESGRTVRVPTSGQPVVELLRDSEKKTGNVYIDVVAGYFVVRGLDDPRVLNEVIKDVEAYPSFTQVKRGGKYVYDYSYYESAKQLSVGDKQSLLGANKRAVLAALEPYGYQVDPADSRFFLHILIGKSPWFEKGEAGIEMVSTSYVMKEGGQVVRIVNENDFVKSTIGYTTDQNVVWVMQPIPGVGTLARYYQASHSNYDGNFGSTRLDLTKKNVVDYLQAMHDRAKR